MSFISAMRKFGARFSRAKSGTTAIEFAMVIGPFMGLLFAIIETALVYLGEFTVDNAAQAAARVIRVGSAQNTHLDADQFKKLVCQNLRGLLPCDSNLIVDVRSYSTFSQAANGMPNPFNGDGSLSNNFAKFQPGGPSQVVVVSVYYDWKLIMTLPAFGDFTGKMGLGLGNMPDGSRLLYGVTAFRTEAY